MVPTFETVLRDSGKQWIVELTYNFNDQNSFEDAKRVTMEAIDENWKPLMLVPLCAKEGHREPQIMNPLDEVKKNAEIFLNYREALKVYIDKLLEQSITSNVLDSMEKEMIRELFWEVELRNQGRFEYVKKPFFKRIKESYSEDVAQKLESISEDVIRNDSFLNRNLINS